MSLNMINGSVIGLLDFDINKRIKCLEQVEQKGTPDEHVHL